MGNALKKQKVILGFLTDISAPKFLYAAHVEKALL